MAGEQDAKVAGGDVEAAPAVRDALSALELGHDRRARSLLQAHLTHTDDAQAMKLLGDVLYDLGDLPGAGAVWFVLGGKGPVVESALQAWRTKHGDDFGKMWNSIPAGVRAEPLSPRLAALKAKADDATRAKEAEAAKEPRAAETKDASPSAEDRIAAASRPDPNGASARRSDRHDSRPGRERARETSPDRGQDGRATASKDVDDEKSGFDAAKLIAWVLAALFVVCAVVGLITILQWIVPGS